MLDPETPRKWVARKNVGSQTPKMTVFGTPKVGSLGIEALLGLSGVLLSYTEVILNDRHSKSPNSHRLTLLICWNYLVSIRGSSKVIIYMVQTRIAIVMGMLHANNEFSAVLTRVQLFRAAW